MSRCRCGEIKSHNEKIDKLKGKLDSIIAYQEEFSILASDLDNVATYNLSAFYSSEMTTLNDDIKGLNDSLEKIRDKIKEKIQDKISQLQSELSEMKKEDEEYHREQEENESATQP